MEPATAEHSLNPALAARSKRRRIAYLLLVGVFLLAAAEITHGIRKGEFNLNDDEPHHAFTGIFVADFLSDMPLAHPVKYTYLYYARYPVLGIVHWPPVFSAVEGLVFLALGASVVTAKLTVLLFALFGFFFWFLLVRYLEGDLPAIASTAVLALIPFMILYERSVMLEIPSLAISIAAIYFWARFLREGASRHVYWFAILAALALLTKQQSIFLVPFCLLTMFILGKWRLLLDHRLWKAIGLVVIIAGPFYALDFLTHSRDIREAVITGNRVIKHSSLFYWSILPSQIGWVLLVLAIAGVLTYRWWGRRDSVLFMLSWIVACYVAFTPIADKEPRYIMNWIPPFIYFAIVPLASGAGKQWMRTAMAAIIILIVAGEARADWRYQRPYVSGYSAVAGKLVSESHPGIVLYDGSMSANFCFFLRVDDPARRFVLMRKGLYAVDESKSMGYDEIINTEPELQNLIRRYGIRYVIVDNGPIEFPIQQTLRNLAKTPQFALIGVFPITTNVASLRGREVSLYENNFVEAPTAKFYRLRMMSLTHDIVVPMRSLMGN
ncbi:MAG: glycosyltransferase family 39 protein [Acidobacteriota bacterium]|nr:glycosyltransferase family 39 protein [Acidobacteriota bacterium]